MIAWSIGFLQHPCFSFLGGMALLAAYVLNKTGNETLEDYLNGKVFANEKSSTIAPDKKDVDGFATFMERYKAGLGIERVAVEGMK